MAEKFIKVLENRAEPASPDQRRRAAFRRSHLEVRIFNVGAGEAILLTFPDKRTWLIDGGATNSTPRNDLLGAQLAKYLKDNALILEALVPSHPHKDHAAAIAPLLAKKPKLARKLMYVRSEDPTWHTAARWLGELEDELGALSTRRLQEIPLANQLKTLSEKRYRAHFFAGVGDGAYTSVFLHLHYGGARLLFTGDAQCEYEGQLLDSFSKEDDFRADVLKVTHHGSSSGTGRRLVDAVRPGIAVASTADDEGHRLEADTLQRLGGRSGRRFVRETVVDGDIILRTDGQPYGGGILYQVEFEKPGALAGATKAEVLSLKAMDKKRSRSAHRACN